MKKLLIITIAALCLLGCRPPRPSTSIVQQQPDRPTYHTSDDHQLQQAFPALRDGETIVYHRGFALVYCERYEQASWVAYMLTHQRVDGQYKKSGNFREDPAIATGSAQLDDYRGSGFDRGHLCPSGSMKWDPIVNDETFLLSNMSPQDHSFNSGLWNTIENRVRSWARLYDTLYVITGPLFTDSMPTIGYNHVAVPPAFYKVVYSPSHHQAIALLVPHEQRKARWSDFAISVDQLEEITGINFLSGIADEEAIEQTIDMDFWHKRPDQHGHQSDSTHHRQHHHHHQQHDNNQNQIQK